MTFIVICRIDIDQREATWNLPASGAHQVGHGRRCMHALPRASASLRGPLQLAVDDQPIPERARSCSPPAIDRRYDLRRPTATRPGISPSSSADFRPTPQPPPSVISAYCPPWRRPARSARHTTPRRCASCCSRSSGRRAWRQQRGRPGMPKGRIPLACQLRRRVLRQRWRLRQLRRAGQHVRHRHRRSGWVCIHPAEPYPQRRQCVGVL